MSFDAGNDSLLGEEESTREAIQQGTIPLPSAILFTCLAPLTMMGNGFLLLTFHRNSKSLLRTPSNFFILSMAWANFLTGCVLEPLSAYRFYALYLNNDVPLLFRKTLSAFSIVTMNASVFSVCAFSWDSLLAVSRPIKHKRWVTVKRSKVFITCLWIYQIGFATLLFTKLPLAWILRVDLHLNTTLISVLLLLSYVCLYKAFKTREQRREKSFNEIHQTSFRTTARGSRVETRLRMIIFLFTLVTTIPILPITVVWHVTWYCEPCRDRQELLLAETVLNLLVFVKFVLDPFVYAWRLERYRTALKRILRCASFMNR